MGVWSICATAQGKLAPGKWPLMGSYLAAAALLPLRCSNLRRSESFAMRARIVLGWGRFLILCLKHCSGLLCQRLSRDRSSVSDTMYGVFPFFACTFLLVAWIARS